jgi:hypothetical protein
MLLQVFLAPLCNKVPEKSTYNLKPRTYSLELTTYDYLCTSSKLVV